MTNREKIVSVLQKGPLCDDCLSNTSKVKPRQTVNKLCRELSGEGFVSRGKTNCPSCRDYKIVNRLVGTKMPEVVVSKPSPIEQDWYWEGNVQKRIVEHLNSHGYTIIQEADTASHEAGVDIEAKSPEGKQLLVSVKGYPKSSQNTQARHWFSQAIFDVVRYRQTHPQANLAIGLPAGFTTYENLVPRVAWLKSTAPFRIFWVKEYVAVLVE